MIAPCGARGRKLLADGHFMVSRARLYGVLSRGSKEARVYSSFQEMQGR